MFKFNFVSWFKNRFNKSTAVQVPVPESTPTTEDFIWEKVIDYENATATNTEIISNGLKMPIQPYPSPSNKTWLESKIKYEGNKSLGFYLEGSKNRIETRIIDIPNNTTRVMAFSVYFDRYFPIPKNWTIFSQWHQGSPASPPVAFEIIPNTSTFQMRILTRNGTLANTVTKHQYNGRIERGRWNNFIVEMRVDDKGGTNGLLNVWLNGSQIVSYRGALGYSDMEAKTNFRFGLYRNPDKQLPSTLYFDSVKIGSRNN